MENNDINNKKEIIQIKLKDLDIISYVKETIISVINNPWIAINTQLINNDSSILYKVEKNNIELARIIVTKFIANNDKIIWYVNSLKKSKKWTSRDVFLLIKYLKEEVDKKEISNIIINVRAYSWEKFSKNLDKNSLRNFYNKLWFIPTSKTLYSYLKEKWVEKINFSLLRIKWQLVWENIDLKDKNNKWKK